MQNKWLDSTANDLVAAYAAKGINADLALRVYSSRLLGQNPELVLHGGGNTSVKTVQTDIFGKEIAVLCVKGSGGDLASIEPSGLPAVQLIPLLATRALNDLSDEAMVSYQRTNLLDFAAPNPSIETLLHAFLPHKFVDHTHANAILSITNQADAIGLCREIFANSLGIVPYIKPGFLLAKAAADVYDSDPDVEGLILLNHGIFTFGTTAKIAYERMINYVSKAEDYIKAKSAKKRTTVVVTATPKRCALTVAELAPIIRGACSYVISSCDRVYHRFILSFRNSDAILQYVNGQNVARYSQTGVITPDHIIRTKNFPLLLPEIPANIGNDLAQVKTMVRTAVNKYIQQYQQYFNAHNLTNHPKTSLDPLPRVILVPGLGLFGLGNTKADADIAADIAENTIRTITDAENIGRYQCLGAADLFEIEYWSLEQAKLKKLQLKPLTSQVVAITGGAGTIGLATAQLLQEHGATIVLLDQEADKLSIAQQTLAPTSLTIVCDITNTEQVAQAFAKICATFGGVDAIISNAGAAWQGKIGEVSDDILRKSFELNFFAHQTIAKQAVKVMLAQETGGNLLFNVSKQAVQPGKNFGPYGLPKAATLALVKQYALEYGEYGIKSNGINADRIRSGLLTSNLIASRAKARNVDEQTYMSGNLLNLEVKAIDVAKAFLNLLLAKKTTAHIMTVDGGNIEASLR